MFVFVFVVWFEVSVLSRIAAKCFISLKYNRTSFEYNRSVIVNDAKAGRKFHLQTIGVRSSYHIGLLTVTSKKMNGAHSLFRTKEPKNQVIYKMLKSIFGLVINRI